MADKIDKQNILQMWAALKTEGDKYKPVWDDISKVTGITVNPDYLWNNNDGKKSQALDEFVDDPTAAISVIQAGDHLLGIIWGTGEKVFDIVPSRYVLELTDKADVEDWYSFATDQSLYHMNHESAGLHTALRPYVYDQSSFGTSGVGAFPNNGFIDRVDDNALFFRNYGIDNTRVDVGKNGLIEVVFTIYHWRVSRIVGNFCKCPVTGGIDDKKLSKLPKDIRQAYADKDFNKEFDLVFGVFPREDFDPQFQGKRGTRYRGVWFMDHATQNQIFHEESFAEKPIAIARQIIVRGEVYGRSSGTLLISTIRSVNFMIATTIEIIEKMSNPSLGMFNNAIFGDSVLDTSAEGITIFNSALTGNADKPIFQVHDVGDPTGIIAFLIPYLNDKIATGFKVDLLLDFSGDQRDITATESLQRFTIRGKSLSSMLQQQKVELVMPLTKRSISILNNLGELGVDPVKDPERATTLRDIGKPDRVIPDAVLQVMNDGRPWFDLKFNNELERLVRTEAVQNLLQVLQTIIAIAGVFPDIIEAVDWYKLLKDINDNLDYNNQILLSEKDFKAKIEAVAQQRQAALEMQVGQAGAAIQKDNATANKTNREAQNVGTK